MSDFGAHTWWRIQAVNWNGTFALSAMLFKDHTGASIATTGGTAIESGHSSTFDSSKLFDSNNSTFWQSASVQNSWAGYEFATPQTVMQIALQKTASMNGSSPPFEVGFQYSDDGIAWTNVCFAVLGSMTNDVPKWFDLAGAL